MSEGMHNKMVPILPEKALDFAWALTIEYSGTEDKQATKTHSEDIRNMLKDIRRSASEKVTQLSVKAKDNRSKPIETLERKKAIKDLNYVNSVLSAISSCERNLVAILRGRDLNFKETEQLMKTSLKNIESADRLAADLHSSIPRVFASGGSAAGTVFVGWFLSALNVKIPEAVIAAAAVIFAGLGYGVYQWQFAPKNRYRSQMEFIKNDYRRGVYYRQYVASAYATLSALFDQILEIYQTIYGEAYDNKYVGAGGEEERKNAVWTVLGGKDGLCTAWCPKIHQHFFDNKITPDTWVHCESGIGYEKCKVT